MKGAGDASRQPPSPGLSASLGGANDLRHDQTQRGLGRQIRGQDPPSEASPRPPCHHQGKLRSGQPPWGSRLPELTPACGSLLRGDGAYGPVGLGAPWSHHEVTSQPHTLARRTCGPAPTCTRLFRAPSRPWILPRPSEPRELARPPWMRAREDGSLGGADRGGEAGRPWPTAPEPPGLKLLQGH